MTDRISTPAQLNFSMPAEWENHEGTLIAWPHNRHDWPGKFAPIRWVYADIVRRLSQKETVFILCNNEGAAKSAASACAKAGADIANVRTMVIPTDRVWTRDSGPIIVTRTHNGQRQTAYTDWQFNAWAKYPNFAMDDQVPERFNDALGHHARKGWKPVTPAGQRIVLEGGSIDVNGAGVMITTEECLLDKETQVRNPALNRADLENAFSRYLGISDVIWLEKGIVGDDTHGHVDDITRFVNADTIVTVTENNPDDENRAILEANLERLKAFRTKSGKSFNVVTLPMPEPLFFDQVRLPASYANFYIANGQVLVPTFNDPNDRIALGILADLFPKRKVTGIHALDLVWGFGTLHCMTQQIPAGIPFRE